MLVGEGCVRLKKVDWVLVGEGCGVVGVDQGLQGASLR